MQQLSSFQRDLMYVVAGLEEPNGLEVRDELESYYSRDVTHGRLYPNLDELVDMGLVKKGKHDERSNYYALTSAGVHAVWRRREWENQYVDSAQALTDRRRSISR